MCSRCASPCWFPLSAAGTGHEGLAPAATAVHSIQAIGFANGTEGSLSSKSPIKYAYLFSRLNDQPHDLAEKVMAVELWNKCWMHG